MPAIPPNRQPAPKSIHTCGQTRLLTHSLRIAAVCTVLVGVCPRSWSESGITNARSTPAANADKSDAAEPKSQKTAIQFVAVRERVEHSVVTRTNDVSVPAPVVVTPTFAPPLTIADYENYIKGDWIDSRSKTQRSELRAPPQAIATTLEQLDARQIIELAKKAVQAPATQPSRDLVVAAPPAPVHEAPPAVGIVPLKSWSTTVPTPTQAVETSIAAASIWPSTDLSDLYKPQTVVASQPTNRSSKVSEANRDSTNSPVEPQLRVAKVVQPIANPSHDAERPVALLSQTPETSTPLPAPAEPKRENVPAPTKTMPVAAPLAVVDGPSELRKPQTIIASQPANRSSHVPEANRDSTNLPGETQLRVAKVSQPIVNPSRETERRVALLAQTPETSTPLPAPPEPKSEIAPAHTETMPVAAPIASTDGPSAPLTTSNFLPANPESYCFRCGVKCPPCGCNPGGPGWAASRPIPWEVFAQGEYVGPARLAHVPVYRLRVDDQLAFVYRLSGQVSGQPYRLNVRDRIQVQSLTVPEVVSRDVIIQPDGTITLPLLGQVRAAGSTLEELSHQLDELFKKVDIKDPRITVTPLDMNSNLQELRSSVDRRYGQGGQVSDARVSPDGTVQLPAIGSVPAQGLTLEELEREIKARYSQIVEGLEVTPILIARAPRFVFVVGEVRLPGRFTMEGPTTLMQAIAMAGSWNVGAQLNEVIVFRRDENWQLMATKVNIRESLLFKKPCPSGEIWLRDSDIVLIPKSPILCADDVINLVFTRGIYGVFPMSATLNFAKLSSL